MNSTQPSSIAHLQVSQALAEQENPNHWQRLMCWVPGSGEGWAFYAERLMGELGYLDDPGAHLGMLDAQLMGAANVALNIGVHLQLEIPAGTGWPEGERWNAEIAWEFLLAHSSWDEKQPVELGGDNRGSALVGGPGELGVELQGGGSLRVPEAPGHCVQVVPAARSWVAE